MWMVVQCGGQPAIVISALFNGVWLAKDTKPWFYSLIVSLQSQGRVCDWPKTPNRGFTLLSYPFILRQGVWLAKDAKPWFYSLILSLQSQAGCVIGQRRQTVVLLSYLIPSISGRVCDWPKTPNRGFTLLFYPFNLRQGVWLAKDTKPWFYSLILSLQSQAGCVIGQRHQTVVLLSYLIPSISGRVCDWPKTSNLKLEWSVCRLRMTIGIGNNRPSGSRLFKLFSI